MKKTLIWLGLASLLAAALLIGRYVVEYFIPYTKIEILKGKRNHGN